MVVHDLHALRPNLCPNEAQAVLIIDADRVLANPILLQSFEPVVRRLS
jgi:hypothetical protein